MFRQTFAALALALLPALAAADDGWPRRIEHANGTLTLPAPPERIVSTSPSLTGTLLAIEAPLIATAAATRSRLSDDDGFFRQWADVAHARGVEVLYPDLSFDIEAVILANPDLIVVSQTGGDSAVEFVPELEAMGFPVLVLNYGINPWEALAQTLGRATGQEAEAQAVTEAFAEHARAAGRAITRPAGSVSIISYNFYGSYGVSKPEGAQARVLVEMGFEVTGVPQAAQGLVQASREFDFVSHENLSAAISGDTIFLLAAEPEDVQAVLDDPVLANLPAVKAGRVYPLGATSFRMDYYSGRAMVDRVAAQFAE